MRDDWARRLRHFTLSIDTVDDENLARIQESLKQYLCGSLGVTFYRLLVSGFQVPVGDTLYACLHTVWAGSSEPRWGESIDYHRDPPVLDPDGSCHSQATYAYYHRKPLWLTAGGEDAEATLAAATEIVDLWSDCQDLDGYRTYDHKGTRTAVILPLEYDHRMFGVMSLEFRERLRPTDPGRQTLRMLATSLARIIWLHTTHTSQRKATARAFEDLRIPDPSVASPLEPRTVFLASSSRADPEVMAILRSVLRRFGSLFELHDWAEQAQSGSINDQIRQDIRSCEFGVCYLSEPPRVKGGAELAYRFLDNPNVLFEAGMMQMLGELRDAEAPGTSRWIPVREAGQLTPAAPFDFAGDRMVIVPRRKDAKLRKTVLERQFKEAVEAQVDALRIR